MNRRVQVLLSFLSDSQLEQIQQEIISIEEHVSFVGDHSNATLRKLQQQFLEKWKSYSHYFEEIYPHLHWFIFTETVILDTPITSINITELALAISYVLDRIDTIKGIAETALKLHQGVNYTPVYSRLPPTSIATKDIFDLGHSLYDILPKWKFDGQHSTQLDTL